MTDLLWIPVLAVAFIAWWLFQVRRVRKWVGRMEHRFPREKE